MNKIRSLELMIEIDYEKENLEITRRYKDMLRSTYQSISKEEQKMIRQAFDLAVVAHKDQRRKSGEPYIYHPIAVAQIVADEIGLGATSIAAALMHDVVEDTEYTLEDIDRLFGPKLAKIIDGLTKISVLNNQDLSIQSENYRKLLLTLSEDIRVILIKIADRLHNMRTLGAMPEKKQLKIASETIFIYAPLAHRLGLYNIKSELEDLSLKYTEPEAYFEIEKKLRESKAEREKYIYDFTKVIEEKLRDENLEFTIKGRPKSIQSIHKKMLKQNVPFENVYDKFAIRIIYKAKDRTNEKFLAWKIYSIVTDKFQPNTSRMRDWISRPKATGYESLHITVMGLRGKWVEVQIRSDRMDEIAEKGIAAHYKYKEGSAGETSADMLINQVRELLESNSTQDTVDFIDNFKLNLYTKEIYVFTPNGDLKSLPIGATTLDFAYAVHSGVGDTCLGAKVNGKLVPLSHELQSGDQVEIITSKQQKPKRDWLDYVVTSRARTKIKTSLNADKREVAEEGKEILIRKLRHLKITYSDKVAHDIANFFGERTAQDLWYKMGMGMVDNKDLKRFAERNSGITGFLNRFRPKSTANKQVADKEKPQSQNLDLLVFGPEEERLDYTFANCCTPIQGDKVFGFLTITKGIKVHKKDCPNAVSMRANYDYRIMQARWIDSSLQEFNAIINITGIDRLGLVNDLTQVISDGLHVNMKSLSFDSNNGIFEGKVSVVVKNKSQLEKVITNLKAVKGINKVLRTYKS